jgi:5-methylcytosine-specific restriction protein A
MSKVSDKMIAAFYNSRSWKMLRQQKLLLNPLCETHLLEGKIESSKQVHHSINLRSPLGWESRFDIKLLFSLCDSCHQSIESEIYLEGQAVERRKQDDELERLGG